jgi:thioredoxin 1
LINPHQALSWTHLDDGSRSSYLLLNSFKEQIMSTHKVTDSSFDTDVLKSSTPVVVDFWAEWCGPCKMIGPSLEEIAKELGPRAKIVKINIDENPGAPSKYGVRGIPTLMVFKDGKLAATKVGAAPKNQLQSWIESSI